MLSSVLFLDVFTSGCFLYTLLLLLMMVSCLITLKGECSIVFTVGGVFPTIVYKAFSFLSSLISFEIRLTS